MKRSLILVFCTSLVIGCGGSGSSGSGSNTGGSNSGGSNTGGSNTGGGTPAASEQTRVAVGSGCTVSQKVSSASSGTQLNIAALNWVQVVQQDMVDDETRLAAGKDTIARVDVISSKTEPLPIDAKLVVGTQDGLCKTYTLRSNATSAPRQIDPFSLNTTYKATIPAADMTQRVISYQVVIDGAASKSSSEASKLYRTGPVTVEQVAQERIVIRPMTFASKAATYPSNAELIAYFKRTLPHSNISISIGKAFVSKDVTRNNAVKTDGFFLNPSMYYYTFDQMVKILTQVDTECFESEPFTDYPSAVKCILFYPDNMYFYDAPRTGQIAGIANPQSLMTLSTPLIEFPRTDPYESGWLQAPALALIHEFMHVMNVGHADACDPDGIDPRLYPGGTIGPHGAGYDSGRDLYFANGGSADFYDFMGYCSSQRWTSDVAYRGIMDYKAGKPTPPAIYKAAARRMTSGSEGTPSVEGKPMLRAAFFGGEWHVAKIVGDSRLMPILTSDASVVSAILAGIPIYGYPTHEGLLANGVIYLPETPAVRAVFSLLSLAI